jgi:sterol desaturase/sphingolipid hydroxylase (fatty acid hydroxylase superfamily)
MGFLEYILADITATLGDFTMIGPRFSWVFLASALVVALICYRKDRSEIWSLKDALRQCFPARVFLHPSSLLDYRYAVVNYFVRLLSFGVFLVSGAGVASLMQRSLESTFGQYAMGTAQAGVLVGVLTAVALVLALDFGLFFAHYLMHRFPVLWEFHKVHHSAEMLTPLTVLRMHPVDMIINSWIVAICVGLVNGAYAHFFPDPENAKWLLLSNSVVFAFYFFGYHLRHSHVWIMFPKGIRQIISSPALHLIHHSTDKKHWDKNFGRIFVHWDRMVGAAYIPTEREEIRFGIGTKEDGEYNSVYKLYMLPFQKSARLIRAKFPRVGRRAKG